MAMDPLNMDPAHLMAPWINHIAATNGTYTPPLKGLYVAVTGTADLTDVAGTTLTGVTLTAGSVWPGVVKAIANISSAVLYSGR